jgi:hypothetical protein
LTKNEIESNYQFHVGETFPAPIDVGAYFSETDAAAAASMRRTNERA